MPGMGKITFIHSGKAFLTIINRVSNIAGAIVLFPGACEDFSC